MPEPTIAEMTAFVAVHGMGAEKSDKWRKFPDGWGWWRSESKGWVIFKPATVPADRDALVEAMREKGWRIGLAPRFSTGYYTKILEWPSTCPIAGGGMDGHADTPGVAVLTAAFTALKGETDG